MVYTFPITGKDRETILHSKTMTQVLLLLLGGAMDVDITQNANHAECIRCG